MSLGDPDRTHGTKPRTRKADVLAKWAAYLERAGRIRTGEETPPIAVFRYKMDGSTEDLK
jgi:hypothetical protein